MKRLLVFGMVSCLILVAACGGDPTYASKPTAPSPTFIVFADVTLSLIPEERDSVRSNMEQVVKLLPSEATLYVFPLLEDVERALAVSRERVAAFERHPERHAQHAARALVMFHLLELREAGFADLVAWMLRTPIYRTVARRAGLDTADATAWASTQLRRLVDDGVLLEHDGRVAVQAHAH